MNTLKGEFELLKMNDMESIDDYSNRVMVAINSLNSNGKDISDVDVT